MSVEPLRTYNRMDSRDKRRVGRAVRFLQMKAVLTGLVVVLLAYAPQGAGQCPCCEGAPHVSSAARAERCVRTHHAQHAGACRRDCCAPAGPVRQGGVCCSACVDDSGLAQALPPETSAPDHPAPGMVAVAGQVNLLARSREYAWLAAPPAAGLPPPELTVISSIVLLS